MIYNLALALFVLAVAPKILWQRWRGKRVPTLRERLGISPPTHAAPRAIWIHAVSVGETKAAQPLLQRLRARYPEAEILITTGTCSGLAEARRTLSAANQFRILPLDFTFIMKRWVRSFEPDWLLFIEGDIWPNLLSQAHALGAKTALVSAKISARSLRRFQRVPSVARHLFASLDLLSVQNEEYQSRFATLIGRLPPIAGNLKLDMQPPPTVPLTRFALAGPAITLACTHAPEEQELLPLLRPLWTTHPDLVLFLAPRHPERFDTVALLLQDLGLPFVRWNQTRTTEPIVLVDAMGQLPHCYAASRLAISAGSFSSHVGGHNLFESCLHACPVLFGPATHTQRELAHLLIQSGAGRQVDAPALLSAVQEWLDNPPRVAAKRLVEQNRGAADRTFFLMSRL